MEADRANKMLKATIKPKEINANSTDLHLFERQTLLSWCLMLIKTGSRRKKPTWTFHQAHSHKFDQFNDIVRVDK
uniref:Uncharacterized protein n=1 Tax=Globodera pallida TaxID=36090 RepID=A0A183BN11_GLOPA